MNGKPLTGKEISQITALRESGHSLPEIMRITKRGSSTVFKYIQSIKVLPEYADVLRVKQGGSKKRAEIAWGNASMRASEMVPLYLTPEQKLFLLLGIYWGEGNKREINMINSDPGMIKTFISCLETWGIEKKQIKVGLRLHTDVDKKRALAFWSELLDIDPEEIKRVETIIGKKTGKLRYGMCRVRVAKSAPYFKLVMSLIETIKERFNAAVVQRIEQGTPKP